MATGSVEIIVDILPSEKQYGWPTYYGTMISITDNTELVFLEAGQVLCSVRSGNTTILVTIGNCWEISKLEENAS